MAKQRKTKTQTQDQPETLAPAIQEVLDQVAEQQPAAVPPVAQPWTDEQLPEGQTPFVPPTDAVVPPVEPTPEPAVGPTPETVTVDKVESVPASVPLDPNDPLTQMKAALELLQAEAREMGEAVLVKKLDLAIRATRQATKLKAAKAKKPAKPAGPSTADRVADMKARGLSDAEIVAALTGGK